MEEKELAGQDALTATGQDEVHDHAWYHAHGIAHDHEGTDHEHASAHPHVHENQKAVVNRLARAIGHLESVKHMVEEGRDCSEVLIQLSAVRSALNSTAKLILEDHIRHCLVDAVEHHDDEAISELCEAVDKFIK